MSKNEKIYIGLIIIVLFIASLIVSYAYFSARIIGNESTSTIKGTAAYLELTFSDGSKQISASNIVPGWSDSKTFSVENTGEETAYYKLKISNITNPLVSGGLSFSITSSNGGATVTKQQVLNLTRVISDAVAIPINTTHNYTITTYYDRTETDQSPDLEESFSYTITIESTEPVSS